MQVYKEVITMKKVGLIILSTLGIVSLAACQSKGGTPNTQEQRHLQKVDRTVTYEPEGIDVDTKVINAWENEVEEEGHQISARILPIKAHNAKLVYTSNNPSVATVDENGIVLGVAPGSTTITVAPEGKPSQAKDVHVFVFQEGSQEEMSAKFAEQLQYQKDHFIENVDEDGDKYYTPTRFVEDEHRDQYFYVIDDPLLPSDQQTKKLIRGYHENEIYEGDAENGYFGIKGINYDVKVEDGNYTYSNYAWLLHNDDTYETHVYHISGSIKNVISIPTQGYIGQDRLEPVLVTLGLMFNNGRKIVTSSFQSILSTGDLSDYDKYSSFITRSGYNDDGYVTYRLEQLAYSGNDTKIDPEDETTYEIPANTPYVADVIIEITWKDGVAVGLNYYLDYTYTDERDPYYINEDGSIRVDEYGEPIEKKYVRNTVINEYNQADDDADITLPTPKGFNPVAELWDL